MHKAVRYMPKIVMHWQFMHWMLRYWQTWLEKLAVPMVGLLGLGWCRLYVLTLNVTTCTHHPPNRGKVYHHPQSEGNFSPIHQAFRPCKGSYQVNDNLIIKSSYRPPWPFGYLFCKQGVPLAATQGGAFKWICPAGSRGATTHTCTHTPSIDSPFQPPTIPANHQSTIPFPGTCH